MSSGSDGGAFRPLQSYCSRRGVDFRNGLPLLDIFEEVVEDITKGENWLLQRGFEISGCNSRNITLETESPASVLFLKASKIFHTFKQSFLSRYAG